MNLEQQKRATYEAIKALEREVYSLEQDYKNTNEDIANLETYLEQLKAKRDSIYKRNYRGESGKLPIAANKLNTAKEKQKRLHLPNVVWIPEYALYNASDYVIEKVTAKRIYVTKISCGGSQYYDKESGKTACYDAILDVEACIKAWELYLQQNK